MAVLAVIVGECQSSWTSVTPGGDRGASLEFRAGMSNGSNLTSHTPSPFYQHLCWSAATVRCINLLSWPLQRLRCMLKGSCAANISRHCFNFDLRSEIILELLCVKSLRTFEAAFKNHHWKEVWWTHSLLSLLANINLVSLNLKGSPEIRRYLPNITYYAMLH